MLRGLEIYGKEHTMKLRKPVETSEKVEEFMERARSRYARNTLEKKKRFPRFLIVINVLVVILVLYLYLTGNPVKTYFKTNMNMGGVNYNVSLSRESRSGKLIFRVTLASRSEGPVTVPFDDRGAACLTLFYGQREILGRCAGGKIREVVLRKNDTRTFAAFLQRNDISSTLKAQFGEKPFMEHRRFFNPGKTLIPLRAVVTINTGGGVSSEHVFKCEVD